MNQKMIRPILVSIVFLCSWGTLAFTWGDGLARNTQKGNELFNAGQYDEAWQAYTEADVKSQADDARLPTLYLNMGNTLTQQGKYEQAVAMYQKALEASGKPAEQADIQYNTGNARLKQKQYQQAIEAYTQALKLQPDHREAQQNKAIAEKLIVQPPQQQQKQQDEQDNKEQQEQQQQQQKQDPPEQDKPEDSEQQQQQKQQEQEPEQQEAAKAEETPEDKEQQLSEEEALRILDALKEKEDLQQQQIQAVPRPVEKDW